MIHSRADFQRIQDPIGKIPENEPVFLLRGQDALSPRTLRFWAKELEEAGGEPEMVEMARNHADLMEEYQAENKVKLPDL